jgi:hypothetical protein
MNDPIAVQLISRIEQADDPIELELAVALLNLYSLGVIQARVTDGELMFSMNEGHQPGALLN